MTEQYGTGGFADVPHKLIEAVRSREELAAVIHAMAADLAQRPEQWENSTLDRFLEGMERWVRDSAGREPAEASWRAFADALIAGTGYE